MNLKTYPIFCVWDLHCKEKIYIFFANKRHSTFRVYNLLMYQTFLFWYKRNKCCLFFEIIKNCTLHWHKIYVKGTNCHYLLHHIHLKYVDMNFYCCTTISSSINQYTKLHYRNRFLVMFIIAIVLELNCETTLWDT